MIDHKSYHTMSNIMRYLPVILEITIVILLYEAVESSNRESSLSAFTVLLRSVASVRKSMAKNINPSSVLQLRARRLAFLLLLLLVLMLGGFIVKFYYLRVTFYTFIFFNNIWLYIVIYFFACVCVSVCRISPFCKILCNYEFTLSRILFMDIISIYI
jgi:hypothetical protein